MVETELDIGAFKVPIFFFFAIKTASKVGGDSMFKVEISNEIENICCFKVTEYDTDKFKDGNILEVKDLYELEELLNEAEEIDFIDERWDSVRTNLLVRDGVFIINIYHFWID